MTLIIEFADSGNIKRKTSTIEGETIITTWEEHIPGDIIRHCTMEKNLVLFGLPVDKFPINPVLKVINV